VGRSWWQTLTHGMVKIDHLIKFSAARNAASRTEAPAHHVFIGDNKQNVCAKTLALQFRQEHKQHSQSLLSQAAVRRSIWGGWL